MLKLLIEKMTMLSSKSLKELVFLLLIILIIFYSRDAITLFTLKISAYLMTISNSYLGNYFCFRDNKFCSNSIVIGIFPFAYYKNWKLILQFITLAYSLPLKNQFFLCSFTIFIAVSNRIFINNKLSEEVKSAFLIFVLLTYFRKFNFWAFIRFFWGFQDLN
jgi:hypothetical protein